MALENINPHNYQKLLLNKSKRIEQTFSEFQIPELEVFASDPLHYRLRAEFRVWHEGDDLFYAMFNPGDNKNPIRVEHCPMVSERIHNMMFMLLDVIKANSCLRYKLFQIDFLSTLSDELLVSLLYHRALDDEWLEQVQALRQQFDINIIGRSRKQKFVQEQDFVMESLSIQGREYHYQQFENSFTQPNGKVCEKMIEWVLDVTEHSELDLIEFYCGHGTFTLPVAQNFRRVIACEIAKTSVNAARFNIARNQIDNIDVLRMSSEDLTLVLQGRKETRKVEGLKLEECQFSTVLVDPPRCGLDEDTVQHVSAYDNIIYISCNPETLRENLSHICNTHQIQRFALFDQFPYTDHIECGVYLSRR